LLIFSTKIMGLILSTPCTLEGLYRAGSCNKPPQAQPAERRQSVDRAPSPHRRPLAPLARNYPHREMGRPRMAPTVASKGQKSHRNHVEDPMGETHNLII